MNAWIVVAIGLAAGLHAALYGAYKDSPHESFLTRRFIRELVFATSIAGFLAGFHLSDGQTPFVIYLSVFALARIATEFWKLFVRVEPQEGYRIPTQIHWVKGVVQNPLIRLMAGKCGLYWAGRGTVKLQSGRIKAIVKNWQDRFRRSQGRSLTLVFVSSAVGIPPFYVITILAGAFRLKFASFIGVGACGRLVRFGLLVFIPQLALRMIGAHH